MARRSMALSDGTRATGATNQDTLVPCAHCGLTVLVRVWHGETRRWEEQVPPRAPFSGAVHNCQDALARWEAFGFARPQEPVRREEHAA